MKTINVNPVVLAFGLVAIGLASAAGGAFVGYGKGYKQGDADGRHQASRSAAEAVSEMMTRGIAIKQSDGTAKTYVLKPSEAPAE